MPPSQRHPTTEEELVQGYSGGRHMSKPQIEHCACGIDIICSPDDIPTGVLAHNATTEHLAWRAAGGMEAHLERQRAAEYEAEHQRYLAETGVPVPPGEPPGDGQA